MKVRLCVDCKELIPIVLFNKDKSTKSGLMTRCKKCSNNRTKEWRSKNIDKVLQYGRDKYIKTREERINYSKKYRAENPDKVKEYRNEYNRTHKEELKEKRKIYCRDKYKTDVTYRIRHSMSHRFRDAVVLKQQGRSWNEYVDYSVDDLLTHLEKQFVDGMSWDNYGEWHIDHRIPIASFDLTNVEQIKDCWSLSNLQPLWAIDNMKKKDKVLYLV